MSVSVPRLYFIRFTLLNDASGSILAAHLIHLCVSFPDKRRLLFEARRRVPAISGRPII
jgi:hypothetical protein